MASTKVTMISISDASNREVSRACLLVLALLLGAVMLACGRVEFIRSPYAIRNLAVTYSQQEDVTLFSWSLGDAIDLSSVTFETWADGDWRVVRFADAPFPAGGHACGQDTCFRLTIPGKFSVPESGVVLRSVHPLHGIQHATPVKLEEREITLSFEPYLRSGNRRLELGVDDFLSEPGTPLRRSYRWSMTPAVNGCESPSTFWDGATEGRELVDVPRDGSEEGTWCVSLSPETQSTWSGDRSVVAQSPVAQSPETQSLVTPSPATLSPVILSTTVLAHPELTYRTHRYVPETEVAPLAYQVIFDLEIPNESRCAHTLELFHQGIAEAFRKRDKEAKELPTVNLSSVPGGCRQQARARLPVADLAEGVKAYVRNEVDAEAGTRVILVYANNLALPLTDTLAVDFFQVQDSIYSESGVETLLVAWGSPLVLASGPWDESIPWVSPTDRNFADSVNAFAEMNLPFLSMLHEFEDPVFFVDPELESKGGLLKYCGSTPRITRWVDDREPAHGSYVFPVGPDKSVAYLVRLPHQMLVPYFSFLEQEVVVHYEVCTRWCSHPFRTPLGRWVANWEGSTTCGEGA